MHITKRLETPSRPDAVRLRRPEKFALLHLMYAVSILEDVPNDLKERLKMIPDGEERFKKVAAWADELLHELRLTVPENQRIGMHHTAMDCEMRITPNSKPSENNVLMTKDEFRELVDSARQRCRECADDDEECERCSLYRLLTSVLPLEDYHGMHMCPYNLGRWEN